MSDSFLIVNSKHRTFDSRSTSDFTYGFSNYGLQINGVALKSAAIPNTQTNINVNNNRFVWKSDTTEYTANIPIGQFNITELIPRLIIVMNAVATGSYVYDAGLDPTTGYIFISQDVGTLQIVVDDNIANSLTTYSPFSNVIGYIRNLGEEVSYVNNNATGLPNLAGVSAYYITSKILTEGHIGRLARKNDMNLVCDVPIDVAYGVLQKYQAKDMRLNFKKFTNKTPNSQFIDIQVRDENNTIVDLQGVDIELVFQVYTDRSTIQGLDNHSGNDFIANH